MASNLTCWQPVLLNLEFSSEAIRVRRVKPQFPGSRNAISGRRYYNPKDGRFINKDPVEESGGLNLYGFCGNDGVNRWDYLGNATINDIWEPGPGDDAVMAQIHPTWVQKGVWDYYDPGSDTEIIWHGYADANAGEGSLDELTHGGFALMASDDAATASWRASNTAITDAFVVTQPTGDWNTLTASKKPVRAGIVTIGELKVVPDSNTDKNGQTGANKTGSSGSAPTAAPNSGGNSTSAQLQQAIAILNKNLSYFSSGGQYAQYSPLVNPVDLVSIGGATSSLGFGVRGEQLAIQAARDGTTLDQGMQLTYYTNVTSASADSRAFTGGLLAVGGAGLDAFTLGSALVNKDGAAASLSGGNLAADLGAAALAGPPGLVVAGGQAAINLTLLGYSGYQNYQDRINTQQNAQISLQVIQQAQQTINRLKEQPHG